MDSLNHILKNLPFLSEEKYLEFYKSNFDDIIDKVPLDKIQEAVSDNCPDFHIHLLPLLLGSLNSFNKFHEIHELVEKIPLDRISCGMDYFYSKIIKYYYNSMKYLGLNCDEFYKHLVIAREFNNKHCVSVLVNSLLDLQINNDVYVPINEDITGEERSVYNFYLGFIYLTKGEYQRALEHFDESDILSNNKKLDSLLTKYIIVTRLLLGDYDIFYPFKESLRPYFALIGAVKRGDLNDFNDTLKDNKKEFFDAKLYFIVSRAITNVVKEGLRKITASCSRILVSDICKILKYNANFLLHKSIVQGGIKGYVSDGVFYSLADKSGEYSSSSGLRHTIDVRKNILKIMKYPEMVPLTYEKIFEESSGEQL